MEQVKKAFTHPKDKYIPVYSNAEIKCAEIKKWFGDTRKLSMDRFKEELKKRSQLCVYIGRNGDGLYKVGYSGNLEQREKQIATHNPKFKIIYKVKTPWAIGVETNLKKYLNCFKVSGEWFKVSDAKINEIIKSLEAYSLIQQKINTPPNKFLNGLRISSTVMAENMPYDLEDDVKDIIDSNVESGCDIYVHKNNIDNNYYLCIEDIEQLISHSKMDLTELINNYIETHMTVDELICKIDENAVLCILKNESLFFSMPKSSQLLCMSRIDSRHKRRSEELNVSDDFKIDILETSDSVKNHIKKYLN